MAAPPIPAGTTIGPVHLTVSDLDRSLGFYDDVLGLREVAREGEVASVGVEEGEPLLVLHRDAEAPPRPRRSTGLFHFAVLVPDREELARSLRRLAERRWSLSGASDHLVSESLYLSDPDGIGIEIYRDRPREEWRWNGGEVEMATLPLDVESLLAEADPGASGPIAARTRIGHVHLNVADLAASEDFYSGLLGFEVTVRTYPGALFVAAGGYHHHVGLNTWLGEGIPAPPDGAIGLRDYEVKLPPAADPRTLADRLEQAGLDPAPADDGGVAIRDPSGIRVLLTTG